MFKKFSVIGGDPRQLTVAGLLKNDGYETILYGFDDEECAESIEEAFDADAIILPVPVSFDGEYINAPFSKKKITVKETVEGLNPAAVVFGGQIKPQIAAALEERGIKHCDYLEREELAIRNAIPTAEGAIEIAVSETPFTLHGSRCLITGYGRIGKILSKMLCGMGAQVSVEARKYADLAMIEGHGCRALALGELAHHIREFDVIFNTVPAMLFDETMLRLAREDTLIIDLASRPGGVDFETAARLGIRVIWALSLPGNIRKW